MDAYQDPGDPRNGIAYHTGKLCIEDCGRPAGTAWSPLWCFPCNVARLDRIGAQMDELAEGLGVKRGEE